ncbi:MAG: hypothetical protein AB8B85_17375 [Paracoccaceae bacterium]
MLRLIGYACLLLALGALALAAWIVADAMVLGNGDAWIATGLWWFQFHADSLQLLQPAIERHVSVWLFESVIQPLLEAPIIAALGGVGLVLLVPGLLLTRQGS